MNPPQYPPQNQQQYFADAKQPESYQQTPNYQSSALHDKAFRSNGQPRFPRQFGVYTCSGLTVDKVIALTADDPSPLFYIEMHSGLSGKPSMTLHSTGSKTSSVLSTVKFHSLTSTNMDVKLHTPESRGEATPRMVKMRPTKSFTTNRYFMWDFDGKEERFEWKSSKGEEVKALKGDDSGKKLVRVSNGEIVMAWAPPNKGIKKLGKMAFLGESLGEGWELMAVMSIICIVEYEERRKTNWA